MLDIIKESIDRKKYIIKINGKNLNTRDGTPDRDFIHISDLCKIHEKVYFFLKKNKNIILNCGSGKRYSVMQIVHGFGELIGKKFKIFYNLTNIKETQTICSNINLLKKKLKVNIKKDTVFDFIIDYI